MLGLRCVDKGSSYGSNGCIWHVDRVYPLWEACDCGSRAPKWVRIKPEFYSDPRTLDLCADGKYRTHSLGAVFELTLHGGD